MSGTRYLRALGLCLLVAVVAVSAEDCDQTKCPGPIAYYEDVKCKPVYEQEGDCCAVRYDCSHLNGRSADKCYANGNEYAIGEELNDKDRAGPCDIGCTCSSSDRGATFACAIVDCFLPHKEGCYPKREHDSCCPVEEICPEDVKDIAKCVVNGITYTDGEQFFVEDNPSLECYCMEGYKGENIAPFCRNNTFRYCSPELKGSPEIRENCAPVYYSTQPPTTSCSVFSRCQNSNDTVIPSQDSPKTDVEVPEEMMCKFGNMSMHLGDELNQATDYSSVCVKCVCDVPPIPTCQRLPDEECDVTVHPNF